MVRSRHTTSGDGWFHRLPKGVRTSSIHHHLFPTPYLHTCNTQSFIDPATPNPSLLFIHKNPSKNPFQPSSQLHFLTALTKPSYLMSQSSRHSSRISMSHHCSRPLIIVTTNLHHTYITHVTLLTTRSDKHPLAAKPCLNPST